MANRLAACFREGFGLEKKDVVLNKPFAGGYITRAYGKGALPWVQVEMNRSLYLSKPWPCFFNHETGPTFRPA